VSEELVLDPNNFACSLFSVPKRGGYVKPRKLRAFYESPINPLQTLRIQSAFAFPMRKSNLLRGRMSQDSLPNSPSAEPIIPEDVALEIRKLAHDLSNALEIIVQTGYLLSTADLKSPASDWLRMLDSGTTKALEINLALRNYIKNHSPR
jgi:hypothetical protein